MVIKEVMPYMSYMYHSLKKDWSPEYKKLRLDLLRLDSRKRQDNGQFSLNGKMINYLEYKILKELYHEIFDTKVYDVDLYNNSPIIIDGGANIGMAMLFFKYKYPESTVYSFEPYLPAFSCLKSNISNNHIKNVIPLNLALSDHDGEMTFNINDSSVCGGIAQWGTCKVEKVACSTLSKLIIDQKLHVDLLKLDIEGSEVAVVNDLNKNNLFQKIDNIIVEVHVNFNVSLPKILCILEDAGYAIQVINDGCVNWNEPRPAIVYAKRKQ